MSINYGISVNDAATVVDTSGSSGSSTGGLTNTELRSSAVVVSAAALPLPAGAATNTELVNLEGITLDAAASNNTRLDSIIAKVTTGFSTVSVSTQIAVGTASTQLIAANSARKYFHIFNNSTTTAYIQYAGAAALNRGIKLSVGGMLTLSGYDLFLGSINAISTTTINLDILEGV